MGFNHRIFWAKVNSAVYKGFLAEKKGKHSLYCTVAGFVSVWMDIIPKAPVLPKDPRINEAMNARIMVQSFKRVQGAVAVEILLSN